MARAASAAVGAMLTKAHEVFSIFWVYTELLLTFSPGDYSQIVSLTTSD